MEPRRQRSDARRHRQKLIEAAAKVFARDGAEAPLENVLVEAGLGRGTLYRHFKDRQSLAAATLELPLDELSSFVKSHPDDGSLLANFLLHYRQLASLYYTSSIIAASSPTTSAFQNILVAADVLYEEVRRRSIAAGVISPDTTNGQMRLVMRLLIGLDTRMEDSLTGREMLQEAIRLMIKSLA